MNKKNIDIKKYLCWSFIFIGIILAIIWIVDAYSQPNIVTNPTNNTTLQSALFFVITLAIFSRRLYNRNKDKK